jgi:Cu/Ag efflux protein CusF
MTYQSLWPWRIQGQLWGAPVWGNLCVLSLFVLIGCATAYELPPLTAKHPAHPEAMTAPEPPLSTTLAYGSSDLPSPQPAIAMAQRQGSATHASAPEPSQTFVGEGKVIAVVPSSNQIVLEHGEIKGFMDAMTMGYRVDPPSLLEGVKAGDQIRFSIGAQQKAIIKIEKLHP